MTITAAPSPGTSRRPLPSRPTLPPSTPAQPARTSSDTAPTVTARPAPAIEITPQQKAAFGAKPPEDTTVPVQPKPVSVGNQNFIQMGGDTYRVRLDADAGTYRLTDPANPAKIGPAVAFRDGQWQLQQTPLGLKGGTPGGGLTKESRTDTKPLLTHPEEEQNHPDQAVQAPQPPQPPQAPVAGAPVVEPPPRQPRGAGSHTSPPPVPAKGTLPGSDKPPLPPRSTTDRAAQPAPPRPDTKPPTPMTGGTTTSVPFTVPNPPAGSMMVGGMVRPRVGATGDGIRPPGTEPAISPDGYSTIPSGETNLVRIDRREGSTHATFVYGPDDAGTTGPTGPGITWTRPDRPGAATASGSRGENVIMPDSMTLEGRFHMSTDSPYPMFRLRGENEPPPPPPISGKGPR